MRQLSKSGVLAAVGLLAGAGLVWCRDTGWSADAANTLPLGAGIPLVVWLGSPWRRANAASRQSQLSVVWPILAGLVFAVAWIFSCITLLALAWTTLAAFWMLRWCRPRVDMVGLLLILALSFPWMVMEWPEIGWWFRLSAAAATESFFHLMQMPVLRNGTELLVLGETIRIEPACAGWNLLQLTLLTGVTIGVHDIPTRSRFLLFLALLPIMAWFANLLRIIVLSALSLSLGVEIAEGLWHGLTGMFVIAAVIGMTKLLSCVVNPRDPVFIRRSVVS